MQGSDGGGFGDGNGVNDDDRVGNYDHSGDDDHCGDDDHSGDVAQDRGDYHCNSCPTLIVSFFARILPLLLILLILR